MKNSWGIDVHYFNKKLSSVIGNLANHTPSELARELLRIGRTADPKVLQESEFRWPDAKSGVYLIHAFQGTEEHLYELVNTVSDLAEPLGRCLKALGLSDAASQSAMNKLLLDGIAEIFPGKFISVTRLDIPA